MAPGYVYAICAVGTSLVKIGMAKNIANRLQVLQTTSPYPLEEVMRYSTEAPRALERYLHQALQAWRQNGEWFNLPGEAMDVRIAALIRQWEARPPHDETCSTPRRRTPRPPCATFGYRLYQLRDARGLRQVDLARQAGLSRQQLNNYEGDRTRPAWEVMLALAAALRVPTEAFDTATYSTEEALTLVTRPRTRRTQQLATTAGKD